MPNDRTKDRPKGTHTVGRVATDGGVSIDVTEQRDDVLVGADMPGFEKQHIDVQVSEQEVTIEAERGDESISRTVELPERVDPQRVDASYDDDILWVTIRKRP